MESEQVQDMEKKRNIVNAICNNDIGKLTAYLKNEPELIISPIFNFEKSSIYKYLGKYLSFCQLTTIHICAILDSLETLMFLLNFYTKLTKNDVNVDLKTVKDETPIHYSIACGSLETLCYLVLKGGDLSIELDQISPLFLGVLSDDINIVKYLLYHGVEYSIDIDEKKFSPISQALTKKRNDILFLLIEKGVTLNWAGGYFTPLHRAISLQRDDIIEPLIKGGANPSLPSYNGDVPIFIALQNRRKKAVKILIKYGANLEVLSPKKWSVVHYAAAGGDKELVQMMLDKGAVADLVDDDGRPPTFAALSAPFEMCKKVLKLLCQKKKVNVNTLDCLNSTVLSEAIEGPYADDRKAYFILSELGADPTIGTLKRSSRTVYEEALSGAIKDNKLMELILSWKTSNEKRNDSEKLKKNASLTFHL